LVVVRTNGTAVGHALDTALIVLNAETVIIEWRDYRKFRKNIPTGLMKFRLKYR
jgi:hypothetical protein